MPVDMDCRDEAGLTVTSSLDELAQGLEQQTNADWRRLTTLRNSTLADGRRLETRRLLYIARASLRRGDRVAQGPGFAGPVLFKHNGDWYAFKQR